MKLKLSICALLLAALAAPAARAQTWSNPGLFLFTGTPPANCVPYELAVATDTGFAYVCFGGTLVQIGGGGSSPIQVTQVPVSSAAMLALYSSPYQLLPAPGAGKMYQILNVTTEFIAGTTGYTLPDGAGADAFAIVTPNVKTFADANPPAYPNISWVNPYCTSNFNAALFDISSNSTAAGYPGVQVASFTNQYLTLKTSFVDDQPIELTIYDSSSGGSASGDLTLGNGTLLITLVYHVAGL